MRCGRHRGCPEDLVTAQRLLRTSHAPAHLQLQSSLGAPGGGGPEAKAESSTNGAKLAFRKRLGESPHPERLRVAQDLPHRSLSQIYSADLHAAESLRRETAVV